MDLGRDTNNTTFPLMLITHGEQQACMEGHGNENVCFLSTK